MTLGNDPPPSRDGAETALRTGEGSQCGARPAQADLLLAAVAERPLPRPWWPQHRAAHRRGAGAMRQAKTRHGLYAQETMVLRRAVRMVCAGHRAVRGAR